MDEADQLAPQRVPADVAKVLHFMEALIRQGRQRGIFMWMLTQRPAVINKNLLSQAETLIAMKMTGPQDRKAIRDWMDAHDPERAAAVERNLAQLTVGQAWAWVPGADFLQRVQFPLFETFDSGRTPKHGEVAADVVLHKLDIGDLVAALQGEDDAADEVGALRAEVARLGRQLGQAQDRADRAERESAAAFAALTAVQDRVGAVIGSPRIHPAPAGTDLDGVLMIEGSDGEVWPATAGSIVAERIASGRGRMRAAAPLTVTARASASVGDPRAAIAALCDAQLARELAGGPPAVRRIVGAIAAAEPADKATIADLAGISPTSSNMGVGLRRLVDRGIIHQEGDRYVIAREQGRTAGG